ncbi:CGNR zinc finger domain-containing protein [Tsukamurella asaccharolytica]|uniref:CGNR zinc finger domain-containing protein n=1 Tax=Tsukamurella asaccharolytica TaxID=2592067 RepID=A0A5C5RDT4_9ACTN|nr:CGNR zinc finger domain-containing protein [Tsukamurella asaccharolytica]TWS20828.1 CGNR zinc finger domain-containing protein [Tsukamurella asaccharolytica]
MHINPYGEGPVLLAVELANDPAVDLADLVRRCAAHDMLVETVGAEDFAGCRALIDAWLTVVDAEDVATRVERLNALLAEHASHPRVTDHAGTGWHIHYRESGATLTGQLAVLILTGTALHLTTRGMNRLGRCASSDCASVFADVSRNGRQRYCSPRCGSREAVRRHRAS